MVFIYMQTIKGEKKFQRYELWRNMLVRLNFWHDFLLKRLRMNKLCGVVQ